MSENLAELIAARFGLADTAGRPGETRGETPGETPGAATLAAMLGHCSHREYAPLPVAEELLDTVLACALSVPTKSDLQQFSIIRLRDEGLRNAIAELIPAMPHIGAAPVFFVFCGDNRRIRRICEMRGKPFANDHLDSFLNAAVDAGMAMVSFIHAAEAAGLGCCPISVLRDHAREIVALLGLPEGVFPLAGLCVGYPAGAGRTSLRLPPAVLVHDDRYDDGRLAEEIAAYDKRRGWPRFDTPDRQRYARTHGVVDDYGWSEDKSRQVSKPERADFGAFIRGHGFTLS